MLYLFVIDEIDIQTTIFVSVIVFSFVCRATDQRTLCIETTYVISLIEIQCGDRTNRIKVVKLFLHWHEYNENWPKIVFMYFNLLLNF